MKELAKELASQLVLKKYNFSRELDGESVLTLEQLELHLFKMIRGMDDHAYAETEHHSRRMVQTRGLIVLIRKEISTDRRNIEWVAYLAVTAATETSKLDSHSNPQDHKVSQNTGRRPIQK